MATSWDETTVTWNESAPGAPWASDGATGAGADYLVVSDGEGSAAFERGWLEIDVTAAVQAIGGGETNLGWRLLPVSGNTQLKRFFSREYLSNPTLRPRLNITYALGGNESPTVTLRRRPQRHGPWLSASIRNSMSRRFNHRERPRSRIRKHPLYGPYAYRSMLRALRRRIGSSRPSNGSARSAESCACGHRTSRWTTNPTRWSFTSNWPARVPRRPCVDVCSSSPGFQTQSSRRWSALPRVPDRRNCRPSGRVFLPTRWIGSPTRYARWRWNVPRVREARRHSG